MGTNETKEVQLGMPLGTAANRLRRSIMFRLIQELGLDTCYRCGQPLTEANYSIDHKQSWLGIDTALFWDLDNIAFSHKRCNYRLGGYANGGRGTSKYKGISYNRQRQKWEAYRYNSGKREWFGYHNTEEEAARALGLI